MSFFGERSRAFMAYVERDITAKLKDYAGVFPVIFLTGPRQSGKSTLLKNVFPDYRYVNLEETDLRERAADDPRGFLNFLGGRAIIDEAQHVPDLFSYIQTFVDESGGNGMFILSGSQNFLLLKRISQSLAGRVGILSLLPFTSRESALAGSRPENTNDWLFTGQYPRLITRGIAPPDFYPNYIKTYVDRDIRFETGVQNLDKFTSFLRICAVCAGNPLNLASVANATGVDARTISSWINVLEESYIIFRLKPYTRKVIPRYSKKPKLYFYDTGLLCNLLGIKSAEELALHKQRGVIFENAVITDYYKSIYNLGGFPSDNTFFWRDSSNRDKEVDLIIERADSLDLYEIKAAETAKRKFADNLLSFERSAPKVKCTKTVIYDGPNDLPGKDADFVNRGNAFRESMGD
jgi:predicted AAA+ superfamily ATPase